MSWEEGDNGQRQRGGEGVASRLSRFEELLRQGREDRREIHRILERIEEKLDKKFDQLADRLADFDKLRNKAIGILIGIGLLAGSIGAGIKHFLEKLTP